MGNPGGGGGPDDEAERVFRLVGELLIDLGEKVRSAGPESGSVSSPRRNSNGIS
ncbi:hypothetical protein ACRJ4B_18695 [Streptomyces sp. GTA36]